MTKNAKTVAKPTIPAVSAELESIVSKLAFSGTNAVPDANFKLESVAYQPSKWAENSRSLQRTEGVNSVVDHNSVLLRNKVCNILLDAVCNKNASVSCLSPKGLHPFFLKIPSSLQPCFKRLLAANQGKIRVKSEVTVEELKKVSMMFRHTVLVLETSEAECFLCLDIVETHKCEPMFFEMKLCFN